MAEKMILTQELLRNVLRYEPDTGLLFWRERPAHLFRPGQSGREDRARSWNKMFANKRAFASIDGVGYHSGCILGHQINAHRVIWMYVYGEWPNQIDHINRDRADNRLANLRNVSRSTNSRNRKVSTRNTSGVIGVRWDRRVGRWRAYISDSGKKRGLGYFDAFDDAVDARRAHEAKLGYIVT